MAEQAFARVVAGDFAEHEAVALLSEIRWPGGDVRCPECGSRALRLAGRRAKRQNGAAMKAAFQCRNSRCRVETSLTAGTHLQNTKLPLRTWLQAAALFAGQPDATVEFFKQRLGVSQKTAWRIRHVLREVSASLALRPLRKPAQLLTAFAPQGEKRVSILASAGRGRLRLQVESPWPLRRRSPPRSWPRADIVFTEHLPSVALTRATRRHLTDVSTTRHIALLLAALCFGSRGRIARRFVWLLQGLVGKT